MDQDCPILLIEDDTDAAMLMEAAFKRVGLQRPLVILTDGDQAIAWLSDDHNPTPCLMVLDVKLPGKSGLEVLSWLRSHADTRPLPVMVLTSSMATADIEQALKLGIRAYVVKPTDFRDLKKLARMIRRKVDGLEDSPEETPPEEVELTQPRPRPPTSRHPAL